MFDAITTSHALGSALRKAVANLIKRHALRAKMLRELKSLHDLSDEHLRDIGLYRSEIERYIFDLHADELKRSRR